MESYYNLDASSIDTDTRQLEAFATILSGRWWGTQLEVTCDISNRTIKQLTAQYRIAAEFTEHFQGALRMEAERENSRAIKLSTIWFSPMYRKQRKGHELGWRIYDLSMPDSNTMIFNEKYRVTNHFAVHGHYDISTINSQVLSANLAEGANQKGFGKLVQDIKTLTLKPDSSLTIERTIYVNGRLVAEEGWILERDYFGSYSN